MKTNLALVALTLLLPGLQAAAPAALSVDDCVRIALQEHPALTAAQAGVTAAAAAVGEARAPYYPRVDLAAGYHRLQRRAYLPGGLTLPGGVAPKLIGPLDDWNGGLVSRLTLVDFGARKAGLSAATARQAGAEALAGATRADVGTTVRTAHHALTTALELEQAAAQNLARAEEHQRLAGLRHQAGAVPQSDVLRATAEAAAARLQLISAQGRVRRLTGELNTAMGRPADTPLAVTAPAELPAPAPIDFAAAVAQALARRPELTASRQRTVVAQAAVSAARAARAPRLQADASYGRRDTAWVPDSREWQAGLTIDLPLFDAGSRQRAVARARAEAAREEADDASRQLQVRQEVWAAQVEVERSWAAVGANEAGRQAAAESLRSVRERYELGAAIITDLLDTQAALARAEAALAEARGQYRTAQAFFARAVGEAKL